MILSLKLTISVLIYNVEGYLYSCLNSIIEQINDSVQVLLIDDGSTDSSGVICDNYAAKDNRIKVIHKENGGIGSARNAAIDNADGDYIWFVDGDDVIVENCVFKILDYLNNQAMPEVLICNYFCFNRDIIKPKKMENTKTHMGKYIDGEQCAFLWGNGIFGAVWHCLFQIEFLLRIQDRFDEGLYCNQDEDWLVSVLMQTNKASVFDEFIYMYRTDREGSITNDSNSFKKFICKKNIYAKWFDFYLNRAEQNDSTRHMTAYFSKAYLNLAGMIKSMNEHDRKKALRCYKENLHILSFGLSQTSKYSFKWW